MTVKRHAPIVLAALLVDVSMAMSEAARLAPTKMNVPAPMVALLARQHARTPLEAIRVLVRPVILALDSAAPT